MDSDRFDTLTRSLSDEMTRRGLLRPTALDANKGGTGPTGGDGTGKKRGTDKDTAKPGKAEHETGKAGHKASAPRKR